MCDPVRSDVAPKSKNRRRKLHRRFSRTRLPTPPPDPYLFENQTEDAPNLQHEEQIIGYINSLQNSNLNDALEPIIATDDAFDQLDKFCKLMDQLLNLKQQNSKLHRQIGNLEHLKKLYFLHQKCDAAHLCGDLPDLDEDSFFAESLLESILIGNKKEPKQKLWTKQRLKQPSFKNQRLRSSSLNSKLNIDVEDDSYRRRPSMNVENTSLAAKVSKWTKVKAAFRWEKASLSVAGAKSQDSGLGGIYPLNYEIARYLRVPSTNEDGISPGDSGAADGSSPGSLSSASSADDIFRHEYQKTYKNRAKHNKKNENIKISEFCKSKILNKNMNRLSGCSDDIRFEIQSDTEDSQLQFTQYNLIGESENNKKYSTDVQQPNVPVNVLERYKKVVAEDEKATVKQKQLNKKISKWIRVKRAFLTSPNSEYVRNKASLEFKNSLNSSDFHKGGEDTKKIYEEIQSNYKQLQKRLSLEFKGKMQEWNKLRSNALNDSAGTTTKSDNVTDDQKNQAFMKKMEEWQRIKAQPTKHRESIQIINEENLAPEFKKKLNEWEKMKKQAAKDDLIPVSKHKKKLGEWPKWKSVTSSNQKGDHSDQNQPYSDEFLKKLEEWRKIKEFSKRDETKDITPSPKLSRRHLSEHTSIKGNKKNKPHDDKEYQLFENELKKIEKEKQNFTQIEERLTKLCKSVVSDGNKKDVLIHTPSGFYKFEGISKEFTRKLCEWEKVQGIKPEESTLALLRTSYTPNITVDLYHSEDDHQAPNSSHFNRLTRSKSAESIAVSNLSQNCSPATHHPSSLSLNNVEDLEKQCYTFSQNSSAQDISSSSEKFPQDEPEALIVEFEDIVEETASPLEVVEEKHFPVYKQEQHNECNESCLVTPHVQTACFKDSRYSFQLIDDCVKLLKTITTDEDRQCQMKMGSSSVTKWRKVDEDDESDKFLECLNRIEIEETNQLQKQRADKLFANLINLREIYSNDFLKITHEDFSINSHFRNLSDTALDIFSDLFQMAEQLCSSLQEKCAKDTQSMSVHFFDCGYSDVLANASELKSKFSEYKRILTYLYAASDIATPRQNQNNSKCVKKVRLANNNDSDSEDASFHPDKSNTNATSRRLNFKKEHSYYSKSFDNNQENASSDEVVTVDPVFLKKFVIPTQSNYINTSNETLSSDTRSPDIFVKTTKKFFAPLIQIESVIIDNLQAIYTNAVENIQVQEPPSHLPPLPPSPKSQRKMSKEISPSIRMMLVKYNQLISEQEGTGSIKSAGSSGSASPVSWRSPASERRVKAQRERYMEVIKKTFEPMYEVKKSASAVSLDRDKQLLASQSKQNLNSDSQTNQIRGILRSTSASTIPAETREKPHPRPLKITSCTTKTYRENDSNSNYEKMQKAKQEFFNLPETSYIPPLSAPPILEPSHNHASFQNRFSQISVGSASSCESSASMCARFLIKSASAGMINVDKDTYRRIDSAYHQDGYVTLPRSIQKEKELFSGGKHLFSNIASKFRKVRMKKSKEHKKMSTVSTLCRQSLIVDITSDSQPPSPSEKQTRSDSLTVPVVDNRASSSEDTSPSSSRSGSWIRRSKLFKAL